MTATPQVPSARAKVPRARMCDVALLCLYWAASGTGLGLASVTSYVAVRSIIFTVVAQPSAGMGGAIVAVSMFLIMAALVSTVVVLPIAFATTFTYAVGARAGLFDDGSHRRLVGVALIVGGLGTVFFVWATGVELSEVSTEQVLTFLGLWLAIAAGWVGPRLWVARLSAGRFSAPRLDT